MTSVHRPTHLAAAYQRLALIALVLLSILPVFTSAQPAGAPADTVRAALDTTREAILDRGEALSEDPEVAKQLIRRTLVPRIDTWATARYVLGDRWQQATTQQREGFHDAFREHAVATYGLLLHRFAESVVAAVRDVRYEVETVRANNRTAHVRASFQTTGDTTREVRVHLHARDGEWLLFDVAYRGFSLMQIRRAEIQGRLREQSLDELIESLRSRHSQGTALPHERAGRD